MKAYAQRGGEAVVFDVGDGLGAVVDLSAGVVYPARQPLMGIIKFGYWEEVSTELAARAEALLDGIDPREISAPVEVKKSSRRAR
jgi:hypothetical protein